MDLRITQHVQRLADDGVTLLSTFWSPSCAPPLDVLGVDMIGARGYLALVAAQKLIRGINLEGSGLLISERLDIQGNLLVDVTVLASCEVGGGLPISLVNRASAGALVGAFQAVVTVLGRGVPGCLLLGPDGTAPSKSPRGR